MKILLAVLVLVLIATVSFADQTFNPFTSQWVTVPNGQANNYQPKFNPFDSSWTIQPQDAKIEFNPFSSKWEFDSGRNK